jgi:uncharacterized protein YjcR
MSTELLSLRELARRTGCHVATVRQWRDRDGLPVYAIGPQRQAVVWSEFIEWLKSHPVRNNTESAMRVA